ncbi:HEPN domain-containing protein [bacterium]|nr:HEPN domain-containing protein [Candidatus Elulimicrobium humile]
MQTLFLRSRRDLNLVLKLLKDEDANQFTSSIGFHCQQAIEKFLKAFLIYNQKEFKRTHALNLLEISARRLILILQILILVN